MTKIKIESPNHTPRTVEFQGRAIVGRSSSLEIRLDDTLVSREHAQVEERGGAVFVTDTSANGTRLDGKLLSKGTPTPWTEGQVVTIRDFRLTLLPVASVPVLEETIAPTPYKAPSPVASAAPLAPVPVPVTAPAPSPAAPSVPDEVLRTDLLQAFPSACEWARGEKTMIVSEVIRETRDVNTFRMRAEDGSMFRYQPGQFIGISVEINGKKVKRTYSISSSPSRPYSIDITVKQIPGGLVSNWLAENLKVGDRIGVRAPAGKFTCFSQPAPKMLMLAAGSGITPLMSMLRWITDTASPIDVVFINSVQSPDDVIFGRELESIAALHPNVRILVTVTAERGLNGPWLGLRGRLDRARIEVVVPDLLERQVFMCGPTPFSKAVTSTLLDMGLPAGQLHQESFGGAPAPQKKGAGAQPVPVRVPSSEPSPSDTQPPMMQPPPHGAPIQPTPVMPPAAPAAPVSPAGTHQVTFERSGLTVDAEEGLTLLEMAEEAGLEIPFSCRVGQCGTCRTRKVSGEVEMDDNDLTPEELAQGDIYACIAAPKSSVVLDA